MLGIVVALNSEAKQIIDLIENKTEKIVAGKQCYLGKLFSKNVVLIVSGIGKVSASLSTQVLIDKFNVSAIINYGTAGGTNNSVRVGSYYLIDKAFQFDFDVREIDNVPLGYIQEYNRVFFDARLIENSFLEIATLATSDRFSKDKTDLENIVNAGASLRDMEGAAILQVAVSNNINTYLIKGVTDVYGSGTDGEQFIKNLKAVCSGFPVVIEKLFSKIIEE